MELVGRKNGDGTVGGVAELQGALRAVVLDEAGAEDFGEVTGSVAAESVHLPETVLRGDEALREEQVVEASGLDGGDAVVVARDRNRAGEAGDVECTVDLRQCGAHSVAKVDSAGEDGDDEDHRQHEDCAQDDAERAKTRPALAAVARVPASLRRGG